MVFSPSNSTLYVANGTSNNVLVYSVSATTGLLTQTSTITIGAGTQPRGLAVSPDGATLYVANQTSNSVSVVNTATNAITTTIPVGSQPVSIAINPAGTLVYVGNATSSNVSVINTATNTVATTINVGSQPIGIVVSPNGRYLYLTATSLNQVRVYDTSSNTLIGTFASASGPSGLAISPDGSTLYVMNRRQRQRPGFSDQRLFRAADVARLLLHHHECLFPRHVRQWWTAAPTGYSAVAAPSLRQQRRSRLCRTQRHDERPARSSPASTIW